MSENINALKIKVCGMRDKNNIAALVQLPIDFIGFIFYPPSPRYIGETISAEIVELIPSTIKKTGVFVNATIHEVLRVASECKLDSIQLHGGETPDYCNAIREKGYEVIKAFKADLEILTCETAEYRYACDYFLFDTPSQKHGGSGNKFDWSILKQQVLPVPFFLSGGIAPGDEELLKSLDIKGLYAIDINSKFEVSPGIKDVEAIREFIIRLKG
jgi:phosphoribosylanthranilate isomerase